MALRFGPGVKLMWAGREAEIQCRAPRKSWKIRDVITDAVSTVSEADLVNEFFSGQLSVVAEEVVAKFVPRKTQKKLDFDFTQLPKKQRREAKRRLAYVIAAEGLPLGVADEEHLGRPIALVAERRNDSSPPTAITLYRWRRDYAAGGDDIRALVDVQKGKGNTNAKIIDVEVLEILEEGIRGYLRPDQPTAQSIFDKVKDKIEAANEKREKKGLPALKCPARSTVYERIVKLKETSSYEVTQSRNGQRAAEYEQMVIGNGVTSKFPLERVEMDHSGFKMFIVDDNTRLPIGCPTFTSSVDRNSTSITGYYLSFTPPSYLSVMKCLKHSITPKSYVATKYPNIENTWDMYGVPSVVVVDNGKEFRSNHFEDAALQIGMTPQYCPVKMPWYKAEVERYFGTMNTNMLQGQPGANLSHVLRKSDYDPEKNAVVTLSAMHEIIHNWIVDIYLQSENGGIEDIPARVWERGVTKFAPPIPRRPDDLNVLLGHLETRKVSKQGIEWCSLFYNCERLALLRTRLKDEPTTIKFDPSDIGVMYALDPEDRVFIPVPAVDFDYASGLSIWQHRVIRRFARQEVKSYVDIRALRRAKSRIQAIFDAEILTSKRSTRRKGMTRFKTEGVVSIKAASVSALPDIPVGTVSMPAISEREQETWKGLSLGMNDSELLAGALAEPVSTVEFRSGPASLKRKRKKSLPAATDQPTESSSFPALESAIAEQPVPALDEDETLDMTGWSGEYVKNR